MDIKNLKDISRDDKPGQVYVDDSEIFVVLQSWIEIPKGYFAALINLTSVK